MTRWFSIPFALCFVTLAVARGAQPEKPPDEPAEPMIPERKLTFETSKEPGRAVSPALKDYRFVAEFVMAIPPLRVCQTDQSLEAADPANPCERARLLHAMFHVQNIDMDLVKYFIEHMPRDRRPPKVLIDALGSRRIIMGATKTREAYKIVPFRIYSPTQQRAEELVRAFLDLYDNGLADTAAHECVRKAREAATELAEKRATLAEARTAIPKAKEQIESLDDYSDIAVSMDDYRAQQRMLDVDLAGTEARIDACNSILRGGRKLPDSRAEAIETIKVTAEIELRGLRARQVVISRIVRGGDELGEAIRRLDRNEGQVNQLQHLIPIVEQRIANYTTDLAAWKANPIEEGKVILHPVEFESPPFPEQ